MATFGEISYSDDVFGGEGGKRVNSKDLFLRLNEGSNEVRLVTAPYQYLTHKYKKEPTNPKDYGQKINCSQLHGECQLCAAGDKPKPRWFYGVIDRKTGTYKILDVSFTVFSAIRKLARNTQRWGDPTKYDIDIVVDKNGGATGYYSVQPISKEPLSASDQQIKDSADLDDLKRRCTPPTPADVQKKIDRINGLDSSFAPTGAKKVNDTSTAKLAVKTNSVNMSDDDDDDDSTESFPAYDGDSA